MPLSNTDNPAADKPVAKPVEKPKPVVEESRLLPTGGSSSPDVQHLASRRAHLVGAMADGVDKADEIATIDAQLAELGYRV